MMTQIWILCQNHESIVAIAEVIIALITGGLFLFSIFRFLVLRGDTINRTTRIQDS